MTLADTEPTGTEPEVIRTHGGMPRWAVMGLTYDEGKIKKFFPYTSEIDGRRFLTRFLIVFTKWGGVHVTRISMPDNQREWPHDHSATFWSWKFGWYAETIFDDPADLAHPRAVRHRRFGIHRLRHDQAHSITAVSPHLWTVLFLGPRADHGSAYWTPTGKQNTGMRMDQEWG